MSTEEGEQFAQKYGMAFLETSAKTAQNVKLAFEQTSSMVLENIDNGVYDLSNERCGIRVGKKKSLVDDERDFAKKDLHSLTIKRQLKQACQC